MVECISLLLLGHLSLIIVDLHFSLISAAAAVTHQAVIHKLLLIPPSAMQLSAVIEFLMKLF